MEGERNSGQRMLADSARPATLARYLARVLIVLVVADLAGRTLTNALLGGEDISSRRLALEIAVTLAVASVGVAIALALPARRMILRIRASVAADESALQERSRAQQFLRDVHNAFEMADFEDELFDVAGVALAEATPGRSEILVADASRAHITPVVVTTGRDAPGCGVLTPHHCPAVRRGTTLLFGDVSGLSSCPRLSERNFDDGAIAACVPINVLGHPSAVLHSVYEHGDMDEREMTSRIKLLEGVAARFGNRLGMIQAIAQTQLQANTDPLTGLLNRRAMENHVRELRNDGTPYSIAMADLDHFKQLNDTFGHDTGDRALRLFARIAQTTLRANDIVSRHGGEEFVLVLPGTDVKSAAPVLHRIREQLSASLESARIPPFTVSMGLADSTWSDDLPELLQATDRALMYAKLHGRDQIVIDDPERPPVLTELRADDVAELAAADAVSDR